MQLSLCKPFEKRAWLSDRSLSRMKDIAGPRGRVVQGPGTNDRHIAERILNVATSMPFVLLGIKTLR